VKRTDGDDTETPNFDYLKSKGYSWHDTFGIVYPLVIVEWDDAYSGFTGWTDVLHGDADVQPHPVQTVGYLIKESKHSVCLGQAIAGRYDANHTGRVSNLFTIPRGMIKAMRILVPGRKLSLTKTNVRDNDGVKGKKL